MLQYYNCGGYFIIRLHLIPLISGQNDKKIMKFFSPLTKQGLPGETLIDTGSGRSGKARRRREARDDGEDRGEGYGGGKRCARGKLRTKCHDRAATDPIAPGRATTRVRQTTCLFLKPGTKQRALRPPSLPLGQWRRS